MPCSVWCVLNTGCARIGVRRCSVTGMAQGLWPTFPNAKGVKLVRMSKTKSGGAVGGAF